MLLCFIKKTKSIALFHSGLIRKINDRYVGEPGANDATEGFMSGVRQVVVAVFLIGEGQDEGVCEAFVQLFGAVVGTPFKTFYLTNF